MDTLIEIKLRIAEYAMLFSTKPKRLYLGQITKESVVSRFDTSTGRARLFELPVYIVDEDHHIDVS